MEIPTPTRKKGKKEKYGREKGRKERRGKRQRENSALALPYLTLTYATLSTFNPFTPPASAPPHGVYHPIPKPHLLQPQSVTPVPAAQQLNEKYPLNKITDALVTTHPVENNPALLTFIFFSSVRLGLAHHLK